MKNKRISVKTKRLNLYPLSDAEIEQLIDECESDELKGAYGQMLEGCKRNPVQRIWYAPWKIELKGTGAHVGELAFMGAPENYSVEIGYGIKPEFEGQGYTTEAVKTMVDWAINNDDVLFVEAEAEADNTASMHILEKIGFRKYGQGEEGPRFVKSKSQTYYMPLFMSLGMCLGISLGMLAFDNMTIGMCIGLCLGISIGSSKDSKIKSKVKKMEESNYPNIEK